MTLGRPGGESGRKGTPMVRVTVKRPDGMVETVERTDLPWGIERNRVLVAKMTDATRKAGRGEIIRIESVASEPIVFTAAELAESKLHQLRRAMDTDETGNWMGNAGR